jgi:phosphate starvation-inducible membrane PsiE
MIFYFPEPYSVLASMVFFFILNQTTACIGKYVYVEFGFHAPLIVIK